MTITLRDYIQNLLGISDVVTRLDTLNDKVDQLIKGEKNIMLDISALQTAVANETTVEQSAITLISGFSQQLKDALAAAQAAGNNSVDPATIQGIVDTMTQSQTALAAAVAANTPAAPAPAQ